MPHIVRLSYLLVLCALLTVGHCGSAAGQSVSRTESSAHSSAGAGSSAFRPRLMIGATAGANMGTVIFQPTVRQKPKIGVEGGVVLRYDAVPYAGIWLEVDYSMRGWHEQPEQYPDLYYVEDLSYVQIPFMTHFMIGNGPLKVTVDGGAHFGYCVAERRRSNFPSSEEEQQLTRVYTQHHGSGIDNRFAWGLGGGVGAEYHMPRMIVGARLSYVYGLGELYRNSSSSLFVKSSEQTFAAKAYLLFPF